MPLYPPPPVAGTNFSLNATSSSVSLSAGAGIGMGQAASTITVSASNQTSSLSYVKAFGTGVATSTGTVVLAAGANITLNTGASSITIVGPTVPAATNFSLNASSSSVSLVAGANITLNSGASSITIVGGAGGAAGVGAIGTAAATSTGTIILAAGANITLNTGANSITIVGAAAGTGGGVVSLNASSGQLSLSAGAGIGIGQAASTMTVSASVQTSSVTLGIIGNTFAGNTNATMSYTNFYQIQAGGLVSVGVSGQSLTISASTSAFPARVDAFGTGAATSTGIIRLVAGANITLNTGASSITIVGASGGAGGGLTLKVTENQPLGMVVDPMTIQTAAAGFVWFGVGGGMFLDRIYIPNPMNLTEIDVAMSIGFPNTSDGAGTLSRSFGIYSFVGTTGLQTVMSFESSSTWGTGTSTAGASNSLTQFQGGWSSPLIQPMTFPVSTLAAGEYAVGQIFKASYTTGTWTNALYGQRAVGNIVVSAATNLTSATVGVLSSAGLSAISAISGISHYASPIVWMGGGGTAANAAGTVVMRQSAGVAASTYSMSKFDLTGSNSAAASFYFAQSALTSNTYFISNLGTRAGSIFTGSTTVPNVSNVGLGALASSTLMEPDDSPLAFIGTNSATTTFYAPFRAGRLSSAFLPEFIWLTDPIAVTGSALRQPWFRLVGS